VNDLAQYCELRRPLRVVPDPEPFRFQTPLVFRLAPRVELMHPRRPARPRLARRFG
jgi:hypothetical protein